MLQQNKKAVSLIVSYVLLISIGLSIAGLVFGWLRFYVDIGEAVECPDGVSLIIMDAPYTELTVGQVELNITLKNRGRFDIEGYVIRIHNRTDATVGIFELNRTFLTIGPGNETKHFFNSTVLSEYGRVCFIEVQPFIKDEKGQIVPCSQVSTRRIDCRL